MRRWILVVVVATVVAVGLILWISSAPPSNEAYERCRASLSPPPSGSFYVDDPCFGLQGQP